MTEVFISVDMEGVAGIATLDQVARGGSAYPAAQRLMTLEANAAIAGAFEGGATGVTVNDSHGTMDNFLLELLDPRAELVTGLPKLQCMAEGARADHDVAFFIGYHAPAGGPGVLAHTFSAHFAQVRVNGEVASEASINALQLGALGVPLGLVSGDDIICAEAERRFPGVRAVQVKTAHGWSATRTVSPARSAELIRDAARASVGDWRSLSAPALPEQFELQVDMPNPTAAEMAAGIPGMFRIDDRTVGRVVTDPDELVGLITVLYSLAASAVQARMAVVNRR